MAAKIAPMTIRDFLLGAVVGVAAAVVAATKQGYF